HAYNGRRTPRTEVMFQTGGTAYVYLIYGIHHLFNVVTAPAETAHAVLIRGLEPTDNLELMLTRRSFTKLKPNLTAGPGTLTKALGIDRRYTGSSLTAADSLIWLEDRGEVILEEQILASPRVGIDYAEECVDWAWRFRVRGSKYTSKAK
ncbi:MAG: DNA-3-methyladenine glycosylase, partial [Saprospiraceae bacterium]